MSARTGRDAGAGGARARAKQRASHGRTHSAGRRWLWLTGVVALAVLAYVGPLRNQASPSASSPASADDARITLVAGTSAPDFTLPSTDGRSVRLVDLRTGGSVLLYFEEGIMCPPCWQQMRDLKRDTARLDALNTTLVTITVDPLEQLKANVTREQVEGMTLLWDKDAAVARSYQALYVSMHPGSRPGHTFILVGTDGKILWRRDFQEMYVPDPTILDPVAKALGR